MFARAKTKEGLDMTLKKTITRSFVVMGAIGLVMLAAVAPTSPTAHADDKPTPPKIFSVTPNGSQSPIANGTRTKQTGFTVVVQLNGAKKGASLTLFKGRAGNIPIPDPKKVGTIDADVDSKQFSFDVDFSKDGPGDQRLVATMQPPAGAAPISSETFDLTLDTVGPKVQDVKLRPAGGGVSLLVITFEDTDVLPASAKEPANFIIHRTGGQGSFGIVAERPSAEIGLTPDNRTVQIVMGAPVTDSYRLQIRSDSATASLKDKLENQAPPGQVFFFSSMPEAENGPHIAFPEFVPRHERKKDEVFNPGDRVETRVARLYYYRDAHRVAQIINRNVKSYNRAAVTQAQRNAEEARDTANNKVAERKQREGAAIRAAEATRAAERQLAEARSTLENVRAVNAQATQAAATPEVAAIKRGITAAGTSISALNTQINDLNQKMAPFISDIETRELKLVELDQQTRQSPDEAKLNKLKTDIKAEQDARDLTQVKLNLLKKKKDQAEIDLESMSDEKAKLEAQIAPLTNASTNLAGSGSPITMPALARTATNEFVAKVAEAEAKVAGLREAERNKQEDIDKAQEAEDRAKENQFRAEVAAATADPDTYAPAQVDSQDPVTQVSVSVIGEGLIQLRGPIRGINKIRTMINQIDSPVGQVKVGIFTVQVNGEHGDRMELVANRIEGNIDISRYLTNQSLALLRRSIQEIAGVMVNAINSEMRVSGHRQIDRDRKYLYAFFGRDFIDELYEMDSSFLRTENKLLSLHSMDTVGQSQAFFIMALAKNDVRQMILERFRFLMLNEMPCLEWDFRRSASLKPCKFNSLKDVCKNVHDKYHFSNLHGFFNAWVSDTDTMTPMQREFIRLAQIFKSQMVAEVELKQRVIERGLIEDQSNTETEFGDFLKPVREKSQRAVRDSYDQLVESQGKLTQLLSAILPLLANLGDDIKSNVDTLRNQGEQLNVVEMRMNRRVQEAKDPTKDLLDQDDYSEVMKIRAYWKDRVDGVLAKADRYPDQFVSHLREIRAFLWNPESTERLKTSGSAQPYLTALSVLSKSSPELGREESLLQMATNYDKHWAKLTPHILIFVGRAQDPATEVSVLESSYGKMWGAIKAEFPDEESRPKLLRTLIEVTTTVYKQITGAEYGIRRSKSIDRRLRRDIDHRKLLEFLTDEQEEKYIELVEGTRSHISQIDTYLKRLAIALEDDFKVQFYDPAFAEVRKASREWDVNLSQVERTTILTNNRAFAKVSPQATMEFDLPKRDIMITEAMNGAKAVVSEYGNLLQDPTFLSLTGMMSGSPAVGGVAGRSPVPGLPGQGLGAAGVRNVLPGQSTDNAEQLMAQTGGPSRKFGSELEKLIPEPAVYKIETGTGFEIRPVIQPDGHSIIYDFDYMYTTNIREPVRPDEKHLGRVKRHFIHTEVQTSSFELREISRYQVALKVSRTSRGVPLMEDIPGLGVMFRPLPSAESSLQQNIILGQSTVYPTLFDLMGLRWSKHIIDLDHINLRDLEHVVRGRNTAIHDFTFDEASKRVDDFLDIKTKEEDHLRKDLYRQQHRPSPFHPGGYQYVPEPPLKPITDPRNNNFTIPDRRPEEYRDPAYDSLRRSPVDDLRQIPTPGGRPEDTDLRKRPPEPEDVNLRGQYQNPIAPAPGGDSGARKKTMPRIGPIQPASYDQPTSRPKLGSDVTGQARASSVPAAPPPSTPVKKKSWLNKVLPSKTK
jgi:RNA binding exosome subunit